MIDKIYNLFEKEIQTKKDSIFIPKLTKKGYEVEYLDPVYYIQYKKLSLSGYQYYDFELMEMENFNLLYVKLSKSGKGMIIRGLIAIILSTIILYCFNSLMSILSLFLLILFLSILYTFKDYRQNSINHFIKTLNTPLPSSPKSN